MKPVIAIINASTILSDEAVAPVVEALQRQVSEHFAPAWNADAVRHSITTLTIVCAPR